jgi:putative flippase GtrA
MSPKLNHQFSRFFVGGLIAVSLDWGAYLFLTQLSGIQPNVSKVIGFIVGTIFAFYYNGMISFQSNLGKTRFIRHISLYTFSMLINVATFNSAMKIAPLFLGSTSIISLTLATSVSMFLNFFGMRSWVFRDEEFSQ